MREHLSRVMTMVLVLLLLPAATTLLFFGREAFTLKKEPTAEQYLAAVVYGQVPADYPEEALKAQVVLARSSFSCQIKDGSMTERKLEATIQKLKAVMRVQGFTRKYGRIQKAVLETRGQVLTYEGEICRGVFHQLSTGHTREGSDVFLDGRFPYITAVESSWDQEARDHIKGYYFTPAFLKQQLRSFGICCSISEGDTIRVKEEDAGGYVIKVQVGDTLCSGEELRQLLHLPSAAFSVELLGKRIRFLCKGAGHGMGMSQYGAGCMAREGDSYQEILQHYFPKTEILTPGK